MMLAGLSAWHAGASQVVVVGSTGDDVRDLREEVARHYLPFAVTFPVFEGTQQPALGETLPFVAAMRKQNAKPTAYVCRDFTCKEPVTSADALAAQLAPR